MNHYNNNVIKNEAFSGESVGFTLKEQIYVRRGEVATLHNEQSPKVTTRIKTTLFWLGRNPLEKNKEYFIKIGTAKVGMSVEEILNVINASNLKDEKKDFS